MKELMNNTSIIIKKADKGSNIVIMNREDYIAEGNRQLSDKKFYRKTYEDLTNEYNRLIQNEIDVLMKRGEIGLKAGSYLV